MKTNINNFIKILNGKIFNWRANYTNVTSIFKFTTPLHKIPLNCNIEYFASILCPYWAHPKQQQKQNEKNNKKCSRMQLIWFLSGNCLSLTTKCNIEMHTAKHTFLKRTNKTKKYWCTCRPVKPLQPCFVRFLKSRDNKPVISYLHCTIFLVIFHFMTAGFALRFHFVQNCIRSSFCRARISLEKTSMTLVCCCGVRVFRYL